jgi:hypothetical protein
MTDSKLVRGSERPLCYFCFIGTGITFPRSFRCSKEDGLCSLTIFQLCCVVESGGEGVDCFAEVCDIYLAPNFNGRNEDVLLLTGAED